jgi:hypothetical protein
LVLFDLDVVCLFSNTIMGHRHQQKAVPPPLLSLLCIQMKTAIEDKNQSKIEFD